MIESINKIAELEKHIEIKKMEIEPIRIEIHKCFHETEAIKKEIVEKYVANSKEFILDKVVEHDSYDIMRFTVIGKDYQIETEVLLEMEDGGQISDYLSHSQVFNLFIHTSEYKRIIRKDNIKTILKNE